MYGRRENGVREAGGCHPPVPPPPPQEKGYHGTHGYCCLDSLIQLSLSGECTVFASQKQKSKTKDKTVARGTASAWFSSKTKKHKINA